jgi:hypothetical protein
MSIPHKPDDVKLIASVFSPEEPLVEEVIQKLETLWGPVDWKSPSLFFDRTRYYEREMGWPLHRRFVSFRELIPPDGIVGRKLESNELEAACLRDGKRAVNIDPGTISLERLILATGKNYIHRVYLSQGIFADLTLIFHRSGFRTLPWTYRDYAEADTIAWFNEIRERYKKQLRGVEEETN